MYGYIRVDEELFPVTSIRLVRGGFKITAVATGPRPAMSGHLRLYSPEGEPVTEWAEGQTSKIDEPALGPEDTMNLTWNLSLATINQTRRVRRR